MTPPLERAIADALADYVRRGILAPSQVRELVEDLACRMVLDTEGLVERLPPALRWKVEP